MHPRVERLPRPDPDTGRFLAAVRRQGPDRTPLIELAIHPQQVKALLGVEIAGAPASRAVGPIVELHYRLGFDVVKVSAPIPWDVSRLAAEEDVPQTGHREWQNQRGGPVQSMADYERFRWPTTRDVNFAPVDSAAAVLPDGMGVVGFCGGVLEFATDLVGLEQFMYALFDQPDLVAAVINRVGETLYGVFEEYCSRDSVCALWLGDDLGGKNGLLVSPGFLASQVFPWYRRFAELAHRCGKPFLLHSCGRTEAVVPTLVEVGIDAKHSFEDSIEPVEAFAAKWSDRLAVLGGIDVGLLASGTEDQVARRTQTVLEALAPTGAYACGSGNSIADYVLPENFLTMVEAVHRFNGRLAD